jgi:ligand-binding SRPBCC domain-containing protein
MPVINLQTYINAPAETCFDMSRSIDLHLQSMQHHNERAIAGITEGLIGLHQTVTWKARHFGLLFKLTVQIIEMQQPAFFVDQMVSGPFKWFRHYHAFWPQGDGTLMVDEFVFKSPLGWLGKLVDKWVLAGYMKRLLQQRNEIIKQAAENAPLSYLKSNHYANAHQTSVAYQS